MYAMCDVSDEPMSDLDVDLSSTAQTAGSLSADEFPAMLLEVLPSLYSNAFRPPRNRADAEDLVQDTALRSFRAIAQFEPGTNFKAWIFRILTRGFWASHRHRQRRPATVDFDDTPDLYLYARSAENG